MRIADRNCASAAALHRFRQQSDNQADVIVRVGWLALRLVIQRKTPEATKATRAALNSTASRQQRTLDPRSLAAAEFMILAATLAAESGPGEDILAVYRLRRQIETAFKRLKSLFHLDRLPTRTEPASRSRLYAHLVLALLCDDLSQEVLASSP